MLAHLHGAKVNCRRNVYPPNYFEIKRELAQLEPLRDYKIDATSYFTQRAPTLPLSRDAPKRTLIVALGGILGGMLGVFWLLVSEAFRRKDTAVALLRQVESPVPIGQ